MNITFQKILVCLLSIIPLFCIWITPSAIAYFVFDFKDVVLSYLAFTLITVTFSVFMTIVNYPPLMRMVVRLFLVAALFVFMHFKQDALFEGLLVVGSTILWMFAYDSIKRSFHRRKQRIQERKIAEYISSLSDQEKHFLRDMTAGTNARFPGLDD